MTIEDNGKEGSVLEKVPSILSVLAFISGDPALQFLTLLLALSKLARQPSPSHRTVKIKKGKRRKPKRRTKKVTPMLKTIRFQ